MSEERFYITDTGLGLDTESDEMYNFGDEEDFCRLFDKLNEQQATIQSLKSDKAIAEDYANIFEKENVKLRKQIGEQQATIDMQELRLQQLEELLELSENLNKSYREKLIDMNLKMMIDDE